jgi:hypothetical protein
LLFSLPVAVGVRGAECSSQQFAEGGTGARGGSALHRVRTVWECGVRWRMARSVGGRHQDGQGYDDLLRTQELGQLPPLYSVTNLNTHQGKVWDLTTNYTAAAIGAIQPLRNHLGNYWLWHRQQRIYSPSCVWRWFRITSTFGQYQRGHSQFYGAHPSYRHPYKASHVWTLHKG